ncbi:hypothetical protein SASPL_154359 [Salvia splendens]|uniref:Receptor-like serine/threonine-protein kinase n=1 Tax=Salvia splendens TaxID=180675 RepID=A0A8X8W015_SALSN|nr:hypothetical protein SASPL_154359 [Salvia splendens]
MDQQRSPSCGHPTTHLHQAEAFLELPTTVKQPLLQRPPSCLRPPSLHSATKLVSCEEKYLGIEGDSKVLNQVDLRLNEKKLVDAEVRAIEVDKIDDDDGLHDSSTIATFDFNGCLAKTSVKGVNTDTWSLMSPSTLEKLHNRYNDELHDAREDMVNGLKDKSIYSPMGVKMMGELDNKPFHVVTIMRMFIEDVYIDYSIVGKMELYYSSAIITITNVLLITHAMDTLNPSHTLRHTTGDTLISSRGTFELGFFNPDDSSKWYVALWYNRIAPKTVVWNPNRDNPLPDSSATLTLTPPGRLLLLDAANATIWSTNTSTVLHNPVAQLLDSGNLVVRYGIDLIVWQSFDFPTDTLLPGMKLGWNYATGREAYMTGGQNLKRNNLFKFGVVMTKAEVYYHYELLNRSSGVAQRFVWNNEKCEWAMYHTVQVDGCDMYNSCGAHGSCNADVVLVCACLKRIKLSDTQHSWFNASLSLRECDQVCSKDCTCMAYASLDISRGENGRLLWFGDLVNIRDMSPGLGHDIYIRLASSESDEEEDEQSIIINSFIKNETHASSSTFTRNFLKLLGWCVQGTEKMLVYEYMTNKSLDLILFNPTRSLLLDWPRWFNIINGIARGLMYLHQDSRLRVIHRDLKASNILLDSDMNPKISDFVLARTFGENETGGNTSRVVGTYGYMSPEYVVDGMFSVKSDVFIFGVIVLEIVSGKRNRGYVHSDHRLNLLGHHPEDRPRMSSVVMMLSNGGALPEAKHAGFFIEREILKSETSVSTTTATSSTNAITVSLVEAR